MHKSLNNRFYILYSDAQNPGHYEEGQLLR